MSSPSELAIRHQPVQARSQARVEAILNATKELLVSHGADAVSMTDLAAAAGLSKQLLYRYFPSKRAVLHELSTAVIAENRELLTFDFDAAHGSPTEAFAEAIRAFCELNWRQPYRQALRAAIVSDAELSQLDLADSEDIAEQIARGLAEHLSTVDERTIRNRALLAIELLDGLVRIT
ncbi:MAG: TetR/AcrR family transcriptional regulator, partial [Acidimicrobiales bacterium]